MFSGACVLQKFPALQDFIGVLLTFIRLTKKINSNPNH